MGVAFFVMGLLDLQNFSVKILLLSPIILFITIIFLSLLEPYLEYTMCPLAEDIFKFLHYICHQAPSRSLWIGNYTIAVCARCFTFCFASAITGIIIYYRSYLKIKWLLGLLLIVPMVMDALTQWFELRASTNVLRILTGISGGIGFSILFYPLYIKFIIYLKNNFLKGGERYL